MVVHHNFYSLFPPFGRIVVSVSILKCIEQQFVFFLQQILEFQMSLTSVLCLKSVSLLQISPSLSYFRLTSYLKFLYFLFCFILASCLCFCSFLALEILPPNFAFQISASPLNLLGTTHGMISSNYQMDCICLIVIITSSHVQFIIILVVLNLPLRVKAS